MLDRPIPQVYVEARVVEITHDSNFELGFDVSFDKAPTGDDTFFRSGTGVFNPDSFLQSLLPGTRPFQGSTLKFGLTGDDAKKYGSLDYAIRALQERGNAEILSEPSIIATQGELASIITGQQTPVQSGEIQGTLSIVRTTFVDTGIRLDITPLLIGKDFVKLDVRPSVTQVTSFIVIAAGGITSPIISKREANSIVSMRDGQMLVIGGLYSTNKIREYRQVPFLGDIPGLGYFFRSNRERDVKSELIFFIRPHIIHEWQEAAVLIPPGERERKGNAETKAPAPESKKTEKVEKKGP
jgi:type II secretory pathway component GspD/PulD (secretin)